MKLVGEGFAQGHAARPGAGPTHQPWPLTLNLTFFKENKGNTDTHKKTKTRGAGQVPGILLGVQEGDAVTFLPLVIKTTGRAAPPVGLEFAPKDHAEWAGGQTPGSAGKVSS